MGGTRSAMSMVRGSRETQEMFKAVPVFRLFTSQPPGQLAAPAGAVSRAIRMDANCAVDWRQFEGMDVSRLKDSVIINIHFGVRDA